MHFHYMNYLAMPWHKNHFPGVMKFTVLVDPSSDIITIPSVCLICAWEKRRRFFKEIMYFHYITYMATP